LIVHLFTNLQSYQKLNEKAAMRVIGRLAAQNQTRTIYLAFFGRKQVGTIERFKLLMQSANLSLSKRFLLILKNRHKLNKRIMKKRSALLTLCICRFFF